MISRRIFLKDGGLALVSLGFAPAFLARTVEAIGGARQKVLIAIFQRGAVDGLNMIVPFGEPEYYKARPTLAIAKPGSSSDAAPPATADQIAQGVLAGELADTTVQTVAKATNEAQRIALLLGSPDFQKR